MLELVASAAPPAVLLAADEDLSPAEVVEAALAVVLATAPAVMVTTWRVTSLSPLENDSVFVEEVVKVPEPPFMVILHTP